mmetsp:Transcript_9310/g.15339  ORF Transcript_9310/g.15339 Transcript_9310/m.15339 type:complete len:341 (+) Transcript_9310:68-1090(+)
MSNKQKRAFVDSHNSDKFTGTGTGNKGSKWKQGKRRKVNSDNKSCGSRNVYDVSESEHLVGLQLLRSVDWDKCQNVSRQNVIRQGDQRTPRTSSGKPFCHSLVLGRNMKSMDGELTYWSLSYPALHEFLKELIAKINPAHQYTHITVNRNLQCKKHTDGGNMGKSLIVAFGEYTGGRLILHRSRDKGSRDHAKDERSVPVSIPYDIFRKFVAFTGSTEEHETESFDGERYSIIYYTSTIVPKETGKRRNSANSTAGLVSTTTATAATSSAYEYNHNNTSSGSGNSPQATAHERRCTTSIGSTDSRNKSPQLLQRFLAIKKKVLHGSAAAAASKSKDRKKK